MYYISIHSNHQIMNIPSSWVNRTYFGLLQILFLSFSTHMYILSCDYYLRHKDIFYVLLIGLHERKLELYV